MSNELSSASGGTAVSELIPAELQQASKFANPQALALVTKVGDYLPYVQLHGANNGQVKEGLIPMGQYSCTVGKKLNILGPTFNCLILGWRPKAMRYSPDVKSFYDPNTNEFKAIVVESEERDSGCGYGPEYLLWLPDLTVFAALFLGSKSGRNAAGIVQQFLYKKATLYADLAVKGKYKWHVPKVKGCDIDFAMPPDAEAMKEVVNKFNNPPAHTEEQASGQDRAR